MADTAGDLINELLTGAMEELDVPRPVEMTMHAIYDDVGRWMGETLGEGDWAIYSQGSGRLGTMVRPADGGDFDIDSVVLRDVPKAEITQQELKDEVGDALDRYVKARASATGPAPTGCQESRRCWTLSFNEPFHMDVLPASRTRRHPRPGSCCPTGNWCAGSSATPSGTRTGSLTGWRTTSESSGQPSRRRRTST